MNEPKYGFHWGNIGAAPIFRRVVNRIINMDDSIQILKDKYNKDKDPLIVMNGFNESKIKPMLTKAKFVNIDKYNNSMPDVRGMSLLQAKIELRKLGYKIKFTGSGQVAWQSPKPGENLIEGSVCSIGLR